MAEFYKSMGAQGLRALLTVAESYALQRVARLRKNGNPWMLDPGVAQLLGSKGLATLVERTEYHYRCMITPKGLEVLQILTNETAQNGSILEKKKN